MSSSDDPKSTLTIDELGRSSSFRPCRASTPIPRDQASQSRHSSNDRFTFDSFNNGHSRATNNNDRATSEISRLVNDFGRSSHGSSRVSHGNDSVTNDNSRMSRDNSYRVSIDNDRVSNDSSFVTKDDDTQQRLNRLIEQNRELRKSVKLVREAFNLTSADLVTTIMGSMFSGSNAVQKVISAVEKMRSIGLPPPKPQPPRSASIPPPLPPPPMNRSSSMPPPPPPRPTTTPPPSYRSTTPPPSYRSTSTPPPIPPPRSSQKPIPPPLQLPPPPRAMSIPLPSPIPPSPTSTSHPPSPSVSKSLDSKDISKDTSHVPYPPDPYKSVSPEATARTKSHYHDKCVNQHQPTFRPTVNKSHNDSIRSIYSNRSVKQSQINEGDSTLTTTHLNPRYRGNRHDTRSGNQSTAFTKTEYRDKSYPNYHDPNHDVTTEMMRSSRTTRYDGTSKSGYSGYSQTDSPSTSQHSSRSTRSVTNDDGTITTYNTEFTYDPVASVSQYTNSSESNSPYSKTSRRESISVNNSPAGGKEYYYIDNTSKTATQSDDYYSTVQSTRRRSGDNYNVEDTVIEKSVRRRSYNDVLTPSDYSGFPNTDRHLIDRPIDEILLPQVTVEQAYNTACQLRPLSRMIGEIVYQLDCRILDEVFSAASDMSVYKRRGFYGSAPNTIPNKIRNESYDIHGKPDPKKELELRFRLKLVIEKLSRWGYQLEFHSDFSQKMVRIYKLIQSRSEKKVLDGYAKYDPRVLRCLVYRLIPDPQNVRNVLILLDCLCFLSRENGEPLFRW